MLFYHVIINIFLSNSSLIMEIVVQICMVLDSERACRLPWLVGGTLWIEEYRF